jgi:hypothetical protein
MTQTGERAAEQTVPLKRVESRGSGRPSSRSRLGRTWNLLVRLILNWGVMLSAVAAVVVVRHHVESEARAPLPVPLVHLTRADARQWQSRSFPSYTGVVPVLLYHGVNTSGAPGSVSPPAFAEQMLALHKAGFHAITLSQYVMFKRGAQLKLPSKPILIVFSDGRLETYRATNNVLSKYGFHATMFTYASWPTSHPGFSLTWRELRAMTLSGIWSVQEGGGSGQQYVVYDAAGDRGPAYAFLKWVSGPAGSRGHPEAWLSFIRRVTSSIRWGEHQFVLQLPDYQPLAFAVGPNYGQLNTNYHRIPHFVISWLQAHFSIVFGGDYLVRAHGLKHQTNRSPSRRIVRGISVNSTITMPVLQCRLHDWVTKTPVSKEQICLAAQYGYGKPASLVWHHHPTA